MAKSADAGKDERPAFKVKETSLGLALTFKAPAHLERDRAGLLLRDEVPVIRRFLDDPVNWPVVGKKPDAGRNSLLALLLSIDRVGGEDFQIIPLDRVCDVTRHARGYKGPSCPLCSVLRIVGRMIAEKLIRVTKVDGEKDDRGHYLHAEGIFLVPGVNFDQYRNKIMRLPLPALLPSASQPDGGGDQSPVRRRLATLPVESWNMLTLEVSPDSFRVAGITGYPSDLGLAQHEWSVLCDLASRGGRYAPKLIGDAETQLRHNIERVTEALKRAFPQLKGDPIKRTGIGVYEAAFAVQSAGSSGSAVW
ncbi:MAG: hypothetical protein ACYTGB_13510 [Planctomycetota bacterium]|jgi:hypothetical protein